MPKTATPRIADLLRLIRRVSAGSNTALRRIDDWTLVAFNPRYPSPADQR
jgi:hypothetical protein